MRDTNLCWQKILAQGFNSSAELKQFLNLPLTTPSDSVVEKQFKTRVPRGFASLMEPGNAADPLLLQVLAQEEELTKSPFYFKDPLYEKKVNPVSGLIHKYPGRVLLTLTGSCAIHCRYCFRRHFPYQENNPGQKGWLEALDYIKNDPSIEEVILSGGDPLLASDNMMENLFKHIEAIDHVKILRFHTRVPIVLPERINSSFLNMLIKLKLKIIFVVHCNHPNEIDSRVANVCKELKKVGCTLLNQSVLLRGVNDSALVLSQLSKRLFECEVLPYYLHLLDKVEGAAHFDLSISRAKSIYNELQSLLPGYLVPTLAREEPGQLHKTRL